MGAPASLIGRGIGPGGGPAYIVLAGLEPAEAPVVADPCHYWGQAYWGQAYWCQPYWHGPQNVGGVVGPVCFVAAAVYLPGAAAATVQKPGADAATVQLPGAAAAKVGC